MKAIKSVLYFLFILFTTAFYSCSDSSGRRIEGVNDSGIQKDRGIKNILPGVWVPDDYIKQIELTKSPYKSSKFLDEVSTMIIESDFSDADSIVVEASWNNHEGYSFTVFFDSSNYLLTDIPDYDINSNNYRLGYDIVKKDTFLILAHFTKNNRLLDQKRFRRIAQNQNEGKGADWGLSFVVNDRIFRGHYKILDSISSEEIQFLNTGEIQNFNDYKNYQVLTDFIGPTNFDNICFETIDSKYQCYAFKFSADTLKLFELIETEEGEKLGAIKYQLLRTKN